MYGKNDGKSHEIEKSQHYVCNMEIFWLGWFIFLKITDICLFKCSIIMGMKVPFGLILLHVI